MKHADRAPFARAFRQSLFRKYALVFGVFVGGALLLSGMLEIGFSYEANRRSLMRLEQEKANAAAARISQYLFEVAQNIAATSIQRGEDAALTKRLAEVKYLRKTIAINSVKIVDRLGKERLSVSLHGNDVIDSGRDFSGSDFFNLAKTGRTYRSTPFVRDGALYMTIAMPVGPPNAGITVAEVDLEFLIDGVTRLDAGPSGHAYIVDGNGKLIAHPDYGLVRNNISLSDLPQVGKAIKGEPVGGHERPDARDMDGRSVLSAYKAIPELGWYLFVEQPLEEAYRPLSAQMWRSALVVLVGVVLALMASIAIVRHMVKPIHVIGIGARRIGSGELDYRIEVSTSDELEELAGEFNRMAEHVQQSYATLEVKVAERTRELEASNRLLAELTRTDVLTGIANRRHFDDVLAQEWSRARRSGQPLAVGLLDVDWFKKYNDTYGHQAGDRCLRDLATVLSNSVCRVGDVVARYGGEEFAFIAPSTTEEGALEMGQRVCDALTEKALPHSASSYGIVTASIGVASIIPHDELDAAVLVHLADLALYKAKNLGRNQALLG